MLRIALACGVIAAIYWLYRRQSVLKGFGFTFHREALLDLGAGVLISGLAMLGIFLVEWILGGIQVTGIGSLPARFSAQLGYYAFGAFFEEFIFRALALSGLTIVFFGRKWLAILATAILFGMVHLRNPGASLVSAFGNGLGGIMYGIAFLGGQNIWLPIGLHFGWNFFQGPVLGFPVSGTVEESLIQQQTTGSVLLTGGTYGPEAGLVGMAFRFAVITLVVVWLQRRSAGKGSLLRLDYPIPLYQNPPRPKPRAGPGLTDESQEQPTGSEISRA
jgi:membrane protease YdiL (CAAX protease family)